MNNTPLINRIGSATKAKQTRAVVRPKALLNTSGLSPEEKEQIEADFKAITSGANEIALVSEDAKEIGKLLKEELKELININQELVTICNEVIKASVNGFAATLPAGGAGPIYARSILNPSGKLTQLETRLAAIKTHYEHIFPS